MRNSNNDDGPNFKFWGSIAAALVLVVFVISQLPFYTVQQGEVAVVTTNGAVTSTAGPGFHVMTPWVDSAHKISTQDQALVYDSKDMEAYSQDTQPANLRVSVRFSIPPDQISAVYAQYGDIDAVEKRLLNRIVPNIVKGVFGQYTASDAVQSRLKLSAQLTDSITAAAAPSFGSSESRWKISSSIRNTRKPLLSE